MTLTPEQKQLVRSTWALVKPIQEDAARLFYGRLFEIDPSTKPLFASTDMAKQGKKLMQTIGVAVAGLERLDAILPADRGSGTAPRRLRGQGGALRERGGSTLMDAGTRPGRGVHTRGGRSVGRNVLDPGDGHEGHSGEGGVSNLLRKRGSSLRGQYGRKERSLIF
jgi:hypothetical protein